MKDNNELIKALKVLCGADGKSCTGSCAPCPADKFRPNHPSGACDDGAMSAAASAIESLTAENAELREANEMLKVEIGLTDKIYADLRNFACQLCGKYKTAHEGSCDGCRWRREK